MDHVIDRARRFNRFYTRAIGVLEDGYLGSGLTLAQARVLYEIGRREPATASDIAAALALDAGYLSRIVKRHEAQGLVRRETSVEDRRQSRLSLTDDGRALADRLEAQARAGVGALLEPLGSDGRARLAQAMDTIEALLSPDGAAPVALRPLRHGDLGWVLERHGVLYAREQGWTKDFEALVARILSDMSLKPDPSRERGWIAERGGQRLGCVFLAQDAEEADAARLRLLLVDPAARGLGLGRRLSEAAVDFARSAGYRTVVLWTHANLAAARRIYAGMGFIKTAEWSHADFGPEVISETWRLDL